MCTLNGHPVERLPGNLNLSFAHVKGEALLMALRDVAVSSGSACTSASLEPSYVLKALGLDDELAHAASASAWDGSTRRRKWRRSSRRWCVWCAICVP